MFGARWWTPAVSILIDFGRQIERDPSAWRVGQLWWWAFWFVGCRHAVPRLRLSNTHASATMPHRDCGVILRGLVILGRLVHLHLWLLFLFPVSFTSTSGPSFDLPNMIGLSASPRPRVFPAKAPLSRDCGLTFTFVCRSRCCDFTTFTSEFPGAARRLLWG